MMKEQDFFMQRCLQLAKNGIGKTRPNPSVGAVIVHENLIIAEGFTSPFGGNHAEVNAIESVKNKSILKQATIYVTLEPCAHYGNTPPCADLLVKHQFKKVVIGCLDTNALVAGKGVARLKAAGIDVIVGVMETECKEHHKRFFTVQNKKRPFVILKWAVSKDGFIAPLHKNERKSIFISNEYSRQIVHKLRSKEHAILVGTNTVLDDNPSLDTRSWFGENPVRIILDQHLRIPHNSLVYNGSVKTIFIINNSKENELKVANLLSKRISNICFETIDFTQNVAVEVCNILQKHAIQSIIIEGGSQTLQTFINANIWDEAHVFRSNLVLTEGVKQPILNGLFSSQNIKDDVLKIYKND